MDPEVTGGEPAVEPTIVPETEEPVDLNQVEETTPEVPGEPEDEDLEDFEWSGRQVRAPKGLKDSVMMHADYTRKTQEVANHRKELDSYKAKLEQQAKATDDELQARGKLYDIDSKLKSYEAYDWNAYQAHRQQDILAADEQWAFKHHLLAEKQEVGKQISELSNARSAEAQQDTAKRMHETEQFARSKGWTAETDKQVIDFALSKGASKEALSQMMSPLVYEMINLARLGQEVLNKPATKTTPQAQPLKLVAAKANPPARKSFADMDMDEYVAARNAQNKR